MKLTIEVKDRDLIKYARLMGIEGPESGVMELIQTSEFQKVVTDDMRTLWLYDENPEAEDAIDNIGTEFAKTFKLERFGLRRKR